MDDHRVELGSDGELKDVFSTESYGQKQKKLPVFWQGKSWTGLLIVVFVTFAAIGVAYYLGQQTTLASVESQLDNLKTTVSNLGSTPQQSEKVSSAPSQKLICVTSNKITSEDWSTADIYTQGTTIFSDKSGNLSTVLDYCTGSKLQVNKNWCYESPLGSGNYVDGDIVFDCPNGCVDGACVKSK